MAYPRLIVDTKKIESNVSKIVALAKEEGITIAGVTKGFCAYPEIVKAFINGGVHFLADSRIENLKKIASFDIPKMMLRLPMISQAKETVEYADISLNSELDTIYALNEVSESLGKIHKVILMVDLGDLREGYFKKEELFNAIDEILKLDNIELYGLGVNLTCYGGVIPKRHILQKLVDYKNEIEKEFGIKIEMLSGGNSSTVHLLGTGNIPNEINNLRLGESIIFGTESAYGKHIDGTDSTAFQLEAEIIEIKEKPSVPTEEIGRDAFGNVPTFVDRGIRKRLICAVGKQDIDLESLYPLDKDLIILGGSSDHTIIDGSDSKIDYSVGDILAFNLHYVSMLRAMTSEYIEKIII